MHVLFELQLEETLGQVETSFFSCVEPNTCINYGKIDKNILSDSDSNVAFIMYRTHNTDRLERRNEIKLQFAFTLYKV